MVPKPVRRWWRRNLRSDMDPKLHVNACGDFTLASQKDWIALRAYPELEMFSIHIDALFCYMAHFGGLQEVILEDPMRIYHIEHSHGWLSKEAPVPRASRTASGVPQLTHRELKDLVGEMRRTGRPLQFNDDDWGLASEDLPETVVVRS